VAPAMKRPEFWKTYAALALLLGLGAYIYFVESKRETGPDRDKEKVFGLDKANVRELTLEPAEGERIRVFKEGEAWRMAEPKAAPADGTECDTLVSTLETLRIDEVVTESPASLAEFGLDKPKVTVGVLTEGAKEPLRISLGEKLPDGSGVYAKLPSAARVFAIPAYVLCTFEKKPFDLRDRSVLHVKRDQVKTLEVTGPEGSYALAKDERGEWVFTKPLATRAGRWTVDGLLGTLENLRMESVAEEDARDLKRFGLDKPVRTVVLGLADGSTRRLEIGGPAGEKKHHAREASSSLVAAIPGAIVDDLAKGMNEYRAKRLLEVATYDVEGFDVEEGAAKRAFAKSKEKDKEGFETSKWKRTSPDAKDLETSKVEDALFKLGGIEVQQFVDQPKEAAAYGLDAPAFKLSLRFGEGKPEQAVELSRKGEAYYARRTGDAALLKLEAAKTEELIKAFKEL
jgi:hypothetical protein